MCTYLFTGDGHLDSHEFHTAPFLFTRMFGLYLFVCQTELIKNNVIMCILYYISMFKSNMVD